jgi:hypothetical protein
MMDRMLYFKVMWYGLWCLDVFVRLDGDSITSTIAFLRAPTSISILIKAFTRIKIYKSVYKEWRQRQQTKTRQQQERPTGGRKRRYGKVSSRRLVPAQEERPNDQPSSKQVISKAKYKIGVAQKLLANKAAAPFKKGSSPKSQEVEDQMG